MRVPSARTGLLIAQSRLRQARDVRAQRQDAQRRLRALARHYEPFLSMGSVAFDIGANHGERTAAFRSLGARVVAVEPQSACVAELRERFAREGDSVEVVACAVAEQPGHVTLRINESDVLSSMAHDWIERTEASGRFEGLSQWTGEERVEAVTLDALVDRYGVPDFCKVDVEGAEPQVFSGLTRPLRVVSYEFAAEALEPALWCLGRLEELGAAAFSFTTAESADLEAWSDASAMRERMNAIAADPRAWGDVYARFS